MNLSLNYALDIFLTSTDSDIRRFGHIEDVTLLERLTLDDVLDLAICFPNASKELIEKLMQLTTGHA
jgi:hypothetical protein